MASVNDEDGAFSNKKRPRPREVFTHGSYNRYYGYRQRARPVSTEESTTGEHWKRDVRLSLFKEEWFLDKDYLDIGCNSGRIPWEVFRAFSPRSIVGVDIDEAVIRIADEKLSRASQRDQHAYKESISFRCYDFAAEEAADHEKATVDVITCLSVTKWVHLNHGDEGLRRLFRRAFDMLRPGGRFILEPQPWKSYKKRRRVSDVAAANFAAIKIRPDAFTSELLSVVGFDSVEELGVPEGAIEGFRRPIMCFKKDT